MRIDADARFVSVCYLSRPSSLSQVQTALTHRTPQKSRVRGESSDSGADGGGATAAPIHRSSLDSLRLSGAAMDTGQAGRADGEEEPRFGECGAASVLKEARVGEWPCAVRNCAVPRSNTHTRTHNYTQALSHTHARARAHASTKTHTHTHTHAHALSHTHACTQPRALRPPCCDPDHAGLDAAVQDGAGRAHGPLQAAGARGRHHERAAQRKRRKRSRGSALSGPEQRTVGS